MERVLSWVSNPTDLEERRQHARRLVGLRLTRVRYVDLDYHRHSVDPKHTGPRLIEARSEWQAPVWQHDACDCANHGVELETSAGRVFSATWDPPGSMEGIGLREEPLLGAAVRPSADVAVWDVTERSRWGAFVGKLVREVRLHYQPWEDPAGFMCPRITLDFGDGVVELLLGDVGKDGVLSPSADNIAVLFSPPHLPPWLP